MSALWRARSPDAWSRRRRQASALASAAECRRPRPPRIQYRIERRRRSAPTGVAKSCRGRRQFPPRIGDDVERRAGKGSDDDSKRNGRKAPHQPRDRVDHRPLQPGAIPASGARNRFASSADFSVARVPISDLHEPGVPRTFNPAAATLNLLRGHVQRGESRGGTTRRKFVSPSSHLRMVKKLLQDRAVLSRPKCAPECRPYCG